MFICWWQISEDSVFPQQEYQKSSIFFLSPPVKCEALTLQIKAYPCGETFRHLQLSCAVEMDIRKCLGPVVTKGRELSAQEQNSDLA